MLLYTKTTCHQLAKSSWEIDAFQQFEQILINKDKPFPCTLGIAGFNADQLRHAFVGLDPTSDSTASCVAATLQSYLPVARSCGKNTSLVIFFKETRDLGITEYLSIFWSLLNAVHKLDSKPWPRNISKDPDSHQWEFSFGGEPIFVVCNTPSHKGRLSRFGKYFTITFQPRWVFKGLIGSDAPNSDKVKGTIRKRLSLFDTITPSPYLGTFGDLENKEWLQYYLDDDNKTVFNKCPFQHTSSQTVHVVEHTNNTELPIVISELLPPTGSVEVQIDTPYRVHPEHSHNTDETLHILKGEISFLLSGQELICRSGDRLLLPAHTRHASSAGSEGCLYVIANRLISLGESASVTA